MKWRIITVGRPALAYAKAGVEEYLGRLRRYGEVEMVWVKEGASALETGRRVLEQAAGCRMVLLDETGVQMTTRQWLGVVDGMARDGVKRLAVLVGGADGHGAEVKAAVAERWALGRMTMQHELALVVWLEQLYRLMTLNRGEPYHRD
jgi:23S rRNA (pseudouridine1915-N3)-methyltransferase